MRRKNNIKTKEVEHICTTCKKSKTCDLWDQVCNIDEDFIKDAFSYDPDKQSICSTVAYCNYYKSNVKRLPDNIQRFVLDNYDDGEFSQHIKNKRSVEDAGDGLLTFLVRELSVKEGCENKEEVLRRLDTISDQIHDLRDAFESKFKVKG